MEDEEEGGGGEVEEGVRGKVVVEEEGEGGRWEESGSAAESLSLS